jgi:type IV secretion system protein VirB2
MHPPMPDPYKIPDRSPSQPPPFQPPYLPNPVDPTRDPWRNYLIPFAVILLSLSARSAFAAAGGGGGMPWDAPLTTISADLTGPAAAAICLIGIVGVFAVLIFGGELNHFVRALCFIVCAGSTLVGTAALFTSFGAAGVEIDGAGYWSTLANSLSRL